MMHLTRRLNRAASAAILHLKIFGFSGIFYILFCIVSRRKKLVRVSRHWSKHPLYIRLNSSDVSVFRQVFIEQEYSITEKIPEQLETIIDAGANIGLTSIFLADRNPNATLYAIEPEESNFSLLDRNTKPYTRIHSMRAAVWGTDGHVRIAREDAAEWAIQVETAKSVDDSLIPAIRLSSLMRSKGLSKVTLLKLDVEGAEWELLEDAQAWIDQVDNIVIELHEQIRPGCEALFERVTPAFQLVAKGRELTLVSRRSG